MIRVSGQQGVPVTVANGDVILGFDQRKFAKLAEKFAGPKRPPLGILAADAEEYLAKHPDKAQQAPTRDQRRLRRQSPTQHRCGPRWSASGRHHHQLRRETRAHHGRAGPDG